MRRVAAERGRNPEAQRQAADRSAPQAARGLSRLLLDFFPLPLQKAQAPPTIVAMLRQLAPVNSHSHSHSHSCKHDNEAAGGADRRRRRAGSTRPCRRRTGSRNLHPRLRRLAVGEEAAAGRHGQRRLREAAAVVGEQGPKRRARPTPGLRLADASRRLRLGASHLRAHGASQHLSCGWSCPPLLRSQTSLAVSLHRHRLPSFLKLPLQASQPLVWRL